MPNRLATSSSPYLRQHADNPVDWFEWGDEAFDAARDRDVPIFLSVGYSSCHWCHVMAHESFEDPGVAQVMNEGFVNVKVDREQRPDVDSVYMSAVQALTGQGGWPMSVFLTHAGTPFYAGTYWPMTRRGRHPSFTEVLRAVSTTWREERATVEERADAIADHLRHAADLGPAAAVDADLLDTIATLVIGSWDSQHGGFGRAPKFPQTMVLDNLLAHHQRTGDPQSLQAAVHSLERMSRGGIHDHVGGGFARYSVDERWLVPHFEKMLYDNAMLLRVFTHAWQVTGQARFARVARQTGRYLIDGLGQPEGGFSSATDADSEGVEGKFFVWTADEFDQAIAAVGEDVRHWRERLGVTDEGNWHDPHGHAPPRANVLHEVIPFDEDDPGFARRWAAVRQSLDERRRLRVPPGLDDKVLVSWNALAIASLAEAGAVLDEPDFVAAAGRAVDFIRDTLVVGGVLHHTWSPGHEAEVPALLEDVALLARALLVLYEADANPAHVSWAVSLAAQAEDEFADGEGAYYASPERPDGPPLIVRPIDDWDNAQPSGASAMVEVNTRLAALTGDQGYRDRAEQTLQRFGDRMRRAPLGYGEMCLAAERLLAGPLEVAIVGEDADELVSEVRSTWMPGIILAQSPAPLEDDAAVPLLAHRPLVGGRAAAYVCRDFACEAPTTEPAELRAMLSAARVHAR